MKIYKIVASKSVAVTAYGVVRLPFSAQSTEAFIQRTTNFIRAQQFFSVPK